MKVFALTALSLAAFVTGLLAAWYWYRASKIGIDPGGGPESGDPQLTAMGWTVGIMQAVTQSAELNKKAALWTAVAIALGALYNVIGILATT